MKGYPVYKRLSTYLRRISWNNERIAHAKKVRGVGPGTFWLDEKAVDKYIEEIEAENIHYSCMIKLGEDVLNQQKEPKI
jgi:hypothetical protein